jgi:hypothetical protein
VIGVYEPTIVLADRQARITSIAAEPGIGGELGECDHQACYVQAHGDDPDLE